jgi:hypothetical protein
VRAVWTLCRSIHADWLNTWQEQPEQIGDATKSHRTHMTINWLRVSMGVSGRCHDGIEMMTSVARAAAWRNDLCHFVRPLSLK